METHRLSILLCQGTQATASSDDGDRLARSSARLFQALVDRDTGAEHWRYLIQRNTLRNVGHVPGGSNTVLLEGTVHGVAGELGSQAERFIGLLAEGAAQARVVQPLDTNSLAELADIIGNQIAARHDDASTFVTTNERQLGGNRPVTVDGVQIGVADARVLDVDEDFLWAGFCDGDLLVLQRAADLVDDLRPLLGRDLVGGHGACSARIKV